MKEIKEALDAIYETRKMVVIDQDTSVFVVEANLIKELRNLLKED